MNLNKEAQQIQRMGRQQIKQKTKINLMSKTMTSTKQSLLQLTQTIRLTDTITFQLNSEYLNQNFLLIKQCLLKVNELQNDMTKQKADKENFHKLFAALEARVTENQKSITENDGKLKQLQNNVGDDFMKKLYDIETRIKNTFDFDETVRRLEAMNKFVLTERFNQEQKKLNGLNDQIIGLKDELNRYVQNTTFDSYKAFQESELEASRDQIAQLNQKNNSISLKLEIVTKQSEASMQEVKQNSKMLKEMNFNELMDKIKKIKEETDHKVGELSIKLKKKCGMSDLTDLQNTLVEKLDKFFAANEKGKASTNQTKEALIYLEKRVNEIYDILVAKEQDEQNDALFSTKKVQCASCTKDMGKYEGKLGQFRPWAIFPCKELDPEKTGGLGYLTYVDKMHYRRGSVPDDSSLERLNRTFNEKAREDDSPRKISTARTTNFMSSFGEQVKQIASLKDEYFKQVKNDKAGNRFFRVKKELVKPSTASELIKEKVKEV